MHTTDIQPISFLAKLGGGSSVGKDSKDPERGSERQNSSPRGNVVNRRSPVKRSRVQRPKSARKPSRGDSPKLRSIRSPPKSSQQRHEQQREHTRPQTAHFTKRERDIQIEKDREQEFGSSARYYTAMEAAAARNATQFVAGVVSPTHRRPATAGNSSRRERARNIGEQDERERKRERELERERENENKIQAPAAFVPDADYFAQMVRLETLLGRKRIKKQQTDDKNMKAETVKVSREAMKTRIETAKDKKYGKLR